jgi:phosphoribosylpyrophosphate synthetase
MVNVIPIFIIGIFITNVIPSSQEQRKSSKFTTLQVNALIHKQVLYTSIGKFSELNQ